jgi:transcription initiation factor TFIIIB Brf1 subunit/transcription initiation factor TFIIB
MKREIAIVAILVATTSALAAQSASQSQPKTLGEVAKAEEARRKDIKKPSKVYTNDDLKPDFTRPAASPPSTAAAAALAGGTEEPAGNASPGAPEGDAAPADPTKTQAYWQERIGKVRSDMDRLKMFGEALQTRINSLTTDYVNRDNRVEREAIEKNRNAALAELERVKKETAAAQAEISKIEEEARKAGVPAGWLRPQ